MTNLSFSALIKFPKSAYFDFNREMEGIAEIDSVSSEGDHYNANIDFMLSDIVKCMTALTTLSGEVIEIITNKSYDSIKTTQPISTFLKKKSGATTKREELIKLLGKWHSAKELRDATGWASSTLHARLTGLRQDKRLMQKTGADGYLTYRLKTAAKAA